MTESGLPDALNAAFELVGALLIVLNIRRVLRDRMVRGVDWRVTAFFSAWGLWNIFYYPHLGQWLSFIAGLLLVSANTTWVLLMLHFIRKEERQ